MLQDLFGVCVCVCVFFFRVLKPCSLKTSKSQANRDGGVREKWARQRLIPTPRSEKEVAGGTEMNLYFIARVFSSAGFGYIPKLQEVGCSRKLAPSLQKVVMMGTLLFRQGLLVTLQHSPTQVRRVGLVVTLGPPGSHVWSGGLRNGVENG